MLQITFYKLFGFGELVCIILLTLVTTGPLAVFLEEIPLLLISIVIAFFKCRFFLSTLKNERKFLETSLRWHPVNWNSRNRYWYLIFVSATPREQADDPVGVTTPSLGTPALYLLRNYMLSSPGESTFVCLQEEIKFVKVRLCEKLVDLCN